MKFKRRHLEQLNNLERQLSSLARGLAATERQLVRLGADICSREGHVTGPQTDLLRRFMHCGRCGEQISPTTLKTAPLNEDMPIAPVAP